MGEIAIGLLRAVGWPFIRHYRVLVRVSWIVVLLLLGRMAYVAVGSLRNRRPLEKGRHEKDDPRS